MFIKVCGLKTKGQIDKAIEFGYDAIGIVTCKKSKRYCDHKKAVELARYAKGRIKTFVVAILYSDVESVASEFDYTQIYELKQVKNLAIASKVFPPTTIDYEYYFYDSSVGSGIFKAFPNWVKDKADNIIIAGGLNPQNVRSVIKDIKPFGIDVSSGVEVNGVKNIKLMKEFIDEARSIDE
ncbi:MAG: hypothetical protein RPU39_01300 [Candidatus Sedimenticola sp. (ex Thyasira tokunagai)]